MQPCTPPDRLATRAFESDVFVLTIMSATNHKKARVPKVAVHLHKMKSLRKGTTGQMNRFQPAMLRIIGLGALTALSSGCGLSSMPSLGDGGIFSSSKKQEAAWTPIITEDSMMTAARTNSDGPIEMAAANGCPPLQVEGGQRDLTAYEGNRIGAAAAVIHRAEITKTARECQLANGVVQVKYGIAGRVVLGPKGKPGTITLSVRMQIYDKAKSKLKSEPFAVNVVITKENPISYFAVVREEIIPVKEGTVPQDYSISIAFEKAKPGVPKGA